jgi:hypothetical protein
MQKLRLAFILPCAQLAIAAMLLQHSYRVRIPGYTPTSRLVCMGLNAPALLFRILDPAQFDWSPDWIPRSLLGFYINDFCFLTGVILVWYLVGRVLDQGYMSPPFKSSGVAGALVGYVLLLTAGIVLLLSGVEIFQRPQYNNPNYILMVLLMWLWSALLGAVACAGLIKRLRLMIRQ